VHEQLVDHVLRADVEREPIAEVWRSTRAYASRLGLPPPGYHTVRWLVISERDRRAAVRSLAVDAVGELWAYPAPDLDRLASGARAIRRRRR
jgi:hypothetical protein